MQKKMLTYAWVFLGLALLMILAQGVSVILVRLDVPPLLNMFLHHLGHARKVLYFCCNAGSFGSFLGCRARV